MGVRVTKVFCRAGEYKGAVTYAFHCPGCESLHAIQVGPGDKGWSFNGDLVKPTVSPSILVNGHPQYRHPTEPRCHSFVKEGRIQFLSDCEHPLAGQTVDLPPYPDADWDEGESEE